MLSAEFFTTLFIAGSGVAACFGAGYMVGSIAESLRKKPKMFDFPHDPKDDPFAVLKDQTVLCGGCGVYMKESELCESDKSCPNFSKKLNAGYTGNLHVLSNRVTNPVPRVGD